MTDVTNPDDELPPEEQEQPLTQEEVAQAEPKVDPGVSDPIWPDDPVSPQYSSDSAGAGPCFPHGIPDQSRNTDPEEPAAE